MPRVGAFLQWLVSAYMPENLVILHTAESCLVIAMTD
eukprot:COSAG02_NODE_5198_length_4548_cov_1.989885_6_plen_37_part_00